MTKLAGEKEPPSFHEIRSLAGRLYVDISGMDVQSLPGPADPATTAMYVDVRESEWISVGEFLESIWKVFGISVYIFRFQMLKDYSRYFRYSGAGYGPQSDAPGTLPH